GAGSRPPLGPCGRREEGAGLALHRTGPVTGAARGARGWAWTFLLPRAHKLFQGEVGKRRFGRAVGRERQQKDSWVASGKSTSSSSKLRDPTLEVWLPWHKSRPRNSLREPRRWCRGVYVKSQGEKGIEDFVTVLAWLLCSNRCARADTSETRRAPRAVCPDLVDKYLEETSIRYVTPRAHSDAEHGLGHPHKSVPPHHPVVCCSSAGPQICTKRPGRGRAPLSSQRKRRKSVTPDPKEKQTCDIRLRVRAEYCQHETALQGNVFSNKQDPLERQFERFNQANTILKSRDLGSIICDIKFSELTYLDAFWRDYINGSLLEALKGVFITDSLKQAVGHEAIKLLVNVDEEDYEVGRQKLLRNLMLQTAP
uniref:Death effector domain containing n=1 Tax=Anser cygnoides TaxID=8845 RepID=A0A8B9DVX7_ANSCY